MCCSFWIGEYHANNPEMSKLLHKAIREKRDNAYTVYQQHLASRPVNVSGDPSGCQPIASHCHHRLMVSFTM